MAMSEALVAYEQILVDLQEENYSMSEDILTSALPLLRYGSPLHLVPIIAAFPSIEGGVLCMEALLPPGLGQRVARCATILRSEAGARIWSETERQ